MKQVETIVLVKDINISKDFYINVMKLEMIIDWGSMLVFKNRLAIHQADLLQPKEIMKDVISNKTQGRNNLIIYIEVEPTQFEEFYNELKEKNVEFIHHIETLPWQRLFRIYDPDKHIIEIGEASEID